MVSFRLHILIPLPHHYIYISPFSFLPNYSTIVFVALPAPCQIIHDADNNMEEYNKNTKCNITLLNLPRLYFPMTNRLIFHPPRQQYPITNYCLCRQWYHSLAHFDTIATPLYIYFPFSFLPNYLTIVFVALPAPCQIIHDADNNMEEYIAIFYSLYNRQIISSIKQMPSFIPEYS